MSIVPLPLDMRGTHLAGQWVHTFREGMPEKRVEVEDRGSNLVAVVGLVEAFACSPHRTNPCTHIGRLDLEGLRGCVCGIRVGLCVGMCGSMR